MLPKENRLVKKADFARVLQNGRVVQGTLFTLVVSEQKDRMPPKAGIIVSKRVSKLATERNRSKRILREGLRSLIKKVKPGTLIVVLGKKKILTARKEEVKKELGNRLASLYEQ
jgi:ribonuclease P protein component